MSEQDDGEVAQDDERDYVRECPTCGTRFVGMTPDEFRDQHADECNPVLGLLFFPTEENA